MESNVNFSSHFHPISGPTQKTSGPHESTALTAAKANAVVVEKGGVMSFLANIGAWINIAVTKAINSLSGSVFAQQHGMKLLSTMVNTPRPELFKEGQQYEVKEHSPHGMALMKGKGATLSGQTKQDKSNAAQARWQKRLNPNPQNPPPPKVDSTPQNVVTVHNHGQCHAAMGASIQLYHAARKEGRGGIEAIQNSLGWGVPITACMSQAVYEKVIELHNTSADRDKSHSYMENAVFAPLGLRATNALTVEDNGQTLKTSRSLGTSRKSNQTAGDVVNSLPEGTYGVSIPPPPDNEEAGHAITVIIDETGKYIIDQNVGIYKLQEGADFAEALHEVISEYHPEGLNANDLHIDHVTTHKARSR